ncbi:MAG TPA: thiamine phosphate synthase [Gemmatimonadales bacterium]|nr:thiamine phosphate synthase [Gemmatimonadales bacterium]
MRPLPRLHAVTDARVAVLPDLGVRAAAIAAAGPAVALHARDRALDGDGLSRLTRRFVALARPPEAAVFVSGRPDVAAALGADGVQLAAGDLAPADARRALPRGWIGRSVHSGEEGRIAVGEGADFLLAGTIFESSSHPGRPAVGVGLVEQLARLGRPVIAIGGVTPGLTGTLREAGAWGVAAISALWDAPDPYARALEFLACWSDT